MRTKTLALALLLAAAVPACSQIDTSEEYICVVNSDCRLIGNLCVNGICKAVECDLDTPCVGGRQCVNFQCVGPNADGGLPDGMRFSSVGGSQSDPPGQSNADLGTGKRDKYNDGKACENGPPQLLSVTTNRVVATGDLDLFLVGSNFDLPPNVTVTVSGFVATIKQGTATALTVTLPNNLPPATLMGPQELLVRNLGGCKVAITVNL